MQGNGFETGGNGVGFGGGRIDFKNSFSTEIWYKNGAKETVLHIEPPKPDPNRMLHFMTSTSSGLCVNLDEVRKFVTSVKSIATPVKDEMRIIGAEDV